MPGLGGCRTDPVTSLCIPNITALPGCAMLVTALNKSVLCNDTTEVYGKGLNSILRDLCWELKQVQWIMCWLSWGDGCLFSWLWFIPHSPVGQCQQRDLTLGAFCFSRKHGICSLSFCLQAIFIYAVFDCFMTLNNMFYLAL